MLLTFEYYKNCNNLLQVLHLCITLVHLLQDSHNSCFYFFKLLINKTIHLKLQNIILNKYFVQNCVRYLYPKCTCIYTIKITNVSNYVMFVYDLWTQQLRHMLYTLTLLVCFQVSDITLAFTDQLMP